MTPPRSLHELVVGPGHEPARRALAPFYRLRRTAALSRIPPPVAERYGLAGQEQHVITVTDRLLFRQTCWNPQRDQKPQNFGPAAPSVAGHRTLDPLLSALGCDFCRPLERTAEDTFGRVSVRGLAVSASNLFKCAAPYHGVIVLTRSHDPLAFGRRDVAALLDCAEGWFREADAAADGDGDGDGADGDGDGNGNGDGAPPRLHPFLLWNALPRAGASQYHGHAQVALTEDPVPEQGALWRAERALAGGGGGGGDERGDGGGDGDGSTSRRRRCYYSSLLRAMGAAGLLRVLKTGGGGHEGDAAAAAADAAVAPPRSSVAYVYASLAPVKDAELVVVVAPSGPAAAAAAEGGGGGLDALRSPALGRALHAALRAVVDGVGGGGGAFNAGVHNLEVRAGGWSRAREGGERDRGGDDDDDEAPPPWQGGGSCGGDDDPPSLFPGGRPVVARVVSRGPPSAVASDFGALEVMGGASIGRTDPYDLMALFDAALEAADGEEAAAAAQARVAGTAETAVGAATAAAAAAEADEEGGRETFALP